MIMQDQYRNYLCRETLDIKKASFTKNVMLKNEIKYHDILIAPVQSSISTQMSQ